MIHINVTKYVQGGDYEVQLVWLYNIGALNSI